jgi:cellobiose phosphorylase
MYRVGLEAILGLTLRAGDLHVDPCIPSGWAGYEIDVHPPNAPTSTYRIRVDNPQGVNRGVRTIEMDDVVLPGTLVPVADDGRVHQVRVVLG